MGDFEGPQVPVPPRSLYVLTEFSDCGFVKREEVTRCFLEGVDSRPLKSAEVVDRFHTALFGYRALGKIQLSEEELLQHDISCRPILSGFRHFIKLIEVKEKIPFYGVGSGLYFTKCCLVLMFHVKHRPAFLLVRHQVLPTR